MTPRSNQQPTKDKGSLPQQEGSWLDRLNSFRVHFERFLWDVAGVLLLTIALLILLGISGLSKGTILSTMVGWLKVWFGWGTLLIALAAGAVGLLAFRRRRESISLSMKQVIALELAFFLTLGVLSVASNYRLSEGMVWGGRSAGELQCFWPAS